MDRRDFFYRQIVSQSVMDEVFDWAEDADHAQNQDLALFGITDEYTVTEDAPTAMTVQVAGPGKAYGKEGERIYMSDLTVDVDMSQDEYGIPTAVSAAGQERWISLFVRSKRVLSDPAVDGNSVTVYTKRQESYELFVRQASEQAAGTGVKPALLSDAILLCDVQLLFGTSAITNADINVDRREDYVRKTGTTIGDLVAGDPKAAIEWLFTELDTFSAPGAVPFTFTSDWFGAATVGQAGVPNYGGAPVTNISDALDAIVWDLAQTYGSDLIGVPDKALTYVSWSSESVEGALDAIAAATNGHIAGGAPAHPASAVTFDDTTTNGAGYGVTSDVQAAIDDIVTELADNASAADGASLIGLYHIAGSPDGFTAATLRDAMIDLFDAVNLRSRKNVPEEIDGWWAFQGSPNIMAGQVGLKDYRHDGAYAAINSYTNTGSAQGTVHPWHEQTTISIGTEHADPCAVASITPNPFGVTPIDRAGRLGHYDVLLPETSGASFHRVDPITRQTVTVAITGLNSGVTEITSSCSDGIDLIVLVRRAAANDSVAKINATTGAVIWEQNLGSVDALAGYPFDRVITGDVTAASPWTVELYILCGNLDPATAGVVEKRDSNVGGLDWSASHAAFTGKKAMGGLAHNGDMVVWTTDNSDGLVPMLSLLNASTGAAIGPIDMASAGTSYDDTSHDLVWDGRHFVWTSISGYLRFYQPAEAFRWAEVVENGTTGGLTQQGFCVVFDGVNVWAPMVLAATYLVDLYRWQAANNEVAVQRLYSQVINNGNSWDPFVSPWSMGRGCRVGAHVCFSCAEPGNETARNTIVVVQNSAAWT